MGFAIGVLLHHEVAGFGMVDDDSARALFGVPLEGFAQFDADALGGEERGHPRLLLEVGAGGVAEGVAGALVAAGKRSRMVGAVGQAMPSSWRTRLCQNSARASAIRPPMPCHVEVFGVVVGSQSWFSRMRMARGPW